MRYLFLFSLLAGVFLTSCKDPCKKVDCQNGGTCIEGECECPEGWLGENCEIKDKCLDVKCENGGKCVDGTCDCPEGYYGDKCENFYDPKTVSLDKVEVLSFPGSKAGGREWDATDKPDIYVTVLDKNNKLLWKAPTIHENADSIGSYFFTKELPFAFETINETYSILLFDDDGSPSKYEWMGGYYFLPYSRNRGIPAQIELSDSASAIKMRLYVSYTF